MKEDLHSLVENIRDADVIDILVDTLIFFLMTTVVLIMVGMIWATLGSTIGMVMAIAFIGIPAIIILIHFS